MKNQYQEISPSRAELVSDNFRGVIQGKSVIEFGASSGETLRDLHFQHGCNVESFDLFPVELDFCKSSYFDLDQPDFTSIKGKIQKCDVVLFLDVLEHVKNPKSVIEKLCEINPDLTIVMISPNFASIRMLQAWVNGFLPEDQNGFYDSTHLKWLSKKWFKINFDPEVFELSFFNVFSKKKYIRFVQILFPKRLCSQFGAVVQKRK